MKVENGKILSLDSMNYNLLDINQSLAEQKNKLDDLINQSQKLIHQSRIHNIYKAHENDFIIDDNIFENDEI